MRYSIILLLAITLTSYRVAAECCGTNGADSCCSAGSGNCNIFCCNCEDGDLIFSLSSRNANRSCTGCATEDTCPDKCLDLCLKGCPPVPADPKEWKWLGQQCYVECGKQCQLPEVLNTLNQPFTIRLARNVFKRGLVKSDETIFREMDGEGKGHFSYEQFLQKQGWQDNEGARAHFDRYVPFHFFGQGRKMLIIDRHDLDGDGVIRIGEMRISGYLDQFW